MCTDSQSGPAATTCCYIQLLRAGRLKLQFGLTPVPYSDCGGFCACIMAIIITDIIDLGCHDFPAAHPVSHACALQPSTQSIPHHQPFIRHVHPLSLGPIWSPGSRWGVSKCALEHARFQGESASTARKLHECGPAKPITQPSRHLNRDGRLMLYHRRLSRTVPDCMPSACPVRPAARTS